MYIFYSSSLFIPVSLQHILQMIHDLMVIFVHKGLENMLAKGTLMAHKIIFPYIGNIVKC